MTALSELQADLVATNASISKIYANLGVKKIEIQTPNGRTVVEHEDFTKVLTILQQRKQELTAQINALMGIKTSIVDANLPTLSIPIVFNSGL